MKEINIKIKIPTVKLPEIKKKEMPEQLAEKIESAKLKAKTAFDELKQTIRETKQTIKEVRAEYKRLSQLERLKRQQEIIARKMAQFKLETQSEKQNKSE